MTLILSCATRYCVVQVSDRRLTRGTEVCDDESNKATLIHPIMAFGYTGLAYLGEEPTDQWMQMQLARGRSLQDAIHELARSATRAFRGIDRRIDRRHAFVGAGWIQVPQDPPHAFRAAIFRIANFYGHEGMLDRAEDVFKIQPLVLPTKREFLLEVTGQLLQASTERSLRRNLGRAVSHQAGPSALIRLLSQAIWREAGTNRTIGTSLMALSVPQPTYGPRPDFFWFSNEPPNPHRPSFLYLHPDRPPINYGPNVITPFSLFRGLEFESVPSPPEHG